MGASRASTASGLGSLQRAPTLDRWFLAILGAFVAATLGIALLGQRATALGRVAAWTAPGSACPAISAREFAAYDAPASSVFSYEGLRFARAYGNARCANVASDRATGLGETPVCQFDGPGILEIRTPSRRYHYAAGIEPMTITFERGAPHCVLNARLRPDWLRN
jgi:hypothetical protein